MIETEPGRGDAVRVQASELTISCRECGEENPYDALRCSKCSRSMIVAYLESEGEGVFPAGVIFPFCRRDYHIGRRMSDDHVVPCHSANSVFVEYMGMGTHHVHPPELEGFCKINSQSLLQPSLLVPGDVLRLGTDLFTYYEGDPPAGLAGIEAQAGQLAHYLLQGAYMEIAACSELNDACEVAVDAVLRLTRMDRGIFFLTDTDESGELILQQCVTRETRTGEGITDVDSPFRISQSLLRKSLTDGGTIIIEDARKRCSVPHSMTALNLTSLACIPIVYSERSEYMIEDCIGIIYADSFMPTHLIESHVQPLLTLLAGFLSVTIMNWRP